MIWCLTDVHPDNGATLHIPGSHRYQTLADVPTDPMAQMVPFEAPAGSIMVMEGRVWHTSGANVTADEDRALLFGVLHQAAHPPAVELHRRADARAAGRDVADHALPARARHLPQQRRQQGADRLVWLLTDLFPPPKSQESRAPSAVEALAGRVRDAAVAGDGHAADEAGGR